MRYPGNNRKSLYPGVQIAQRIKLEVTALRYECHMFGSYLTKWRESQSSVERRLQEMIYTLSLGSGVCFFG